MAAHGIDRIPDSLGFLVLTEDGAVISSGGQLENDEVTANKITKLVHTAYKIQVTADKKDTLRRISDIMCRKNLCKSDAPPPVPPLHKEMYKHICTKP